MPSNISGKLNEISKLLSKYKTEELNEFLVFQYKSHITCSEIANRLEVAYEDAKKLIGILLKYEDLEMHFKVYCKDELDVQSDTIYESILDIPDERCGNCERNCNILKNVIVIYKVINRGIYGEV